MNNGITSHIDKSGGTKLERGSYSSVSQVGAKSKDETSQQSNKYLHDSLSQQNKENTYSNVSSNNISDDNKPDLNNKKTNNKGNYQQAYQNQPIQQNQQQLTKNKGISHKNYLDANEKL